ncbi:tetratricopeptide repeat protein [Dendronalium sp. ChiSLP03b]|uniref:tetratricopeptide repeat protein n=1 Tax=Dendronalium sp. ChiSLP03b TaxID=3075381 RepID=UPI002AD4760B|nr:tetratricopeptide repeat protein [Dendronalium sp. ChiSLP03b]MDZ8205734.1 tetratricopeptide repeat protein [Dendronalium sp. ChiSLP03b]
MKFNYALTPAIIGVSIAFVQPQIAVALSSAEVAKVAKDITVQIDNQNGSGTGVIIKEEGDFYTVLTAKHVIDTQAKYQIITPDGERHPLISSTVKKLPEVDLAVVQFTSRRRYSVAKIGNSNESAEGTTTYVAGFPQATAAISNTIYNFTDGRITANASKPLRDGYALVYTNNTLPGMSGGPVLNEKGELVGVHGRADEADIETSTINPTVAYVKSGFNLGIPINTFLRLSAQVGVDMGVSPPSTSTAAVPKADNYYIQAGDKYDKGDFQGAIADYTQAIKLNPNYLKAYNNRGLARYLLGDNQGAIIDFNQVLKLDSSDIDGYNNRGLARYNLGDKKGALADYSQALRFNPKYALAYNNRGIARNNLDDNQGAIADFNQAIKINPNYAEAYAGRGLARYQLKDQQGAINDYNQALRINPKLATAYTGRGVAKSDLGDKQGAIADYNQALKINPNFAPTYTVRGITRYQLGDKKGAIADLQKAANLNLEQGKTDDYQQLLELIKKLQ